MNKTFTNKLKNFVLLFLGAIISLIGINVNSSAIIMIGSIILTFGFINHIKKKL